MKITEQIQKTYQTTIQALKNLDLTFEEHFDDLVIVSGAKGNEMPVPLVINVNTNNEVLAIYSELPLNIDEKARNRIAVAINMINYSIVNGSFDYDYNSGRVIFRMAHYLPENDFTVYDVRRMIVITCGTVNRFNHRIAKIAQATEISLDQIKEIVDGN